MASCRVALRLPPLNFGTLLAVDDFDYWGSAMARALTTMQFSNALAAWIGCKGNVNPASGDVAIIRLFIALSF